MRTQSLTARSRHVEWPTIAVAVAIAAGFAAVLASHDRLPTRVRDRRAGRSSALGTTRCSTRSIHGHPTPWPRFNTALAMVPIGPRRVLRHLSVDAPRPSPRRRSSPIPTSTRRASTCRRATWARCGRVRRAALRGDADPRRTAVARSARGGDSVDAHRAGGGAAVVVAPSVCSATVSASPPCWPSFRRVGWRGGCTPPPSPWAAGR